MKLFRRWFLLSVLFTAVFAACTSAAETTATPAIPAPEEQDLGNTLADTRWILASFGPTGAEMAVIEGTAVTLEFDSGGQAGGNGGCNSYGTTYQVQEGSLTFGETTSTLMACTDEGVSEQEQAYLQALSSADSFTQNANNLTILYDNGQGTLNFVPAN